MTTRGDHDDCHDPNGPEGGRPRPTPRPVRCACRCHGRAVVHVDLVCDCGRPVVPCSADGDACPPQPGKPQPGIVDVPDHEPPFETHTDPVPIWEDPDRPATGSPGEIPWFRGKLDDLTRNGPRFGPRKNEFLPYLLVRAASGDRGGRPFGGVFWESPDILVLPDQEAESAPPMPLGAGGTARASVPNTLYAHVWNLGRAPAFRVRVEFYWFNPSLGFSRSAANLVGATYIDLADRFTHLDRWTEVEQPYGRWLTRGCHAVVPCPTTWVPSYVNNGHECLVVRAFEPLLDALSPDQFQAAADRHVGQRNIAVVPAASPAALDLALDLGWFPRPGDAEVDVELVPPNAMDWLRVLTHRRNPGLVAPAERVSAGLLPPAPLGSARRTLGLEPGCDAGALLTPSERFRRGCDPLELTFHASVRNLRGNEAQVLRVRQRIDGDVIGGYSVVLVGDGAVSGE
jgi:hypothetical protein